MRGLFWLFVFYNFCFIFQLKLRELILFILKIRYFNRNKITVSEGKLTFSSFEEVGLTGAGAIAVTHVPKLNGIWQWSLVSLAKRPLMVIKESHPPSLHCALTLNSRSSFAIFRAPENPSFITLIFHPFFR